MIHDTPVSVDIVDVMPDAVHDRADAITPGAYVFDAYGGRHKIARVRRHKNGDVRIDREDGWYDIWQGDELVTFVRAK